VARWLIRFGYEGSSYGGWARQPGRLTIEGALRKGLTRSASDSAIRLTTLEVASRTDRGVSARGNALTVESRLEGPAILRVMNGASPDIWFTDAAPVPEEFRVRRAQRRVYRYFESDAGRSLERTRAAAQLFRGEVDVRSFGRQLTSGPPARRPIEAVEVLPEPEGWVIEVRARSFVWGMVRKIVAALREVDAGRLDLETLSAALRGEGRVALPLAEPEPLVLWDVEYPIAWTVHWTGPNRKQSSAAQRGHSSSRARLRLLREMGRDRDGGP
jgi:tRNA pseudouridine38-40 synthase